MTDDRPVLALIPGDPTGVGPEITARILSDGALAEVARIVVVGDRRVLERGATEAGVSLDLREAASPAEARFDGGVPLVDLANMDPDALPVGRPDAEAGRLTGETLARAIEFARAGEVEAITFAPLNKRALFDGGWRFPDEHKMFAHLLGHSGDFSEMNVLDGLWMTRVTSHVALREALDQITEERIVAALHLAYRTMKGAGIDAPRIAVAALNPHGGEGGLFGREEIDVIAPAVERARREGIDCSGPFPSDTVYLKAFRGEVDSVLAMYHDQGQIATKVRGFMKGVTVTAGLDTVFTTPAHGTAYDIVGRGVADTGATEAAIRLAARLAARKRAAAPALQGS